MARKYAKYTEEVDGILYAVVRLPLGNGKYAKRSIKIPGEIKNPAQWAKQWAMARLGDHQSGKTLARPAVIDDITFTVFADWYKENFLVPPIYDKKTGKIVAGMLGYKEEKTRVNKLIKDLGILRLDTINVDTVRAYKIKRLQSGIQLSTINRYFNLLKCMFDEAVEREWMPRNPFQSKRARLIDTVIPQANNKKMTPRFAARLLARSRKSHAPLLHYLILTMRYTGARPSELYPLKESPGDGIHREPLTWQSILDSDFKKLTLVSYKKKIRLTREVPICERLERGLRELYKKTPRVKPTDRLFPFASHRKGWETLCKSARIPKGVVLRDFRSFFNMELRDNPMIDEVTRMQILGHSQIKTNAHYMTHLSDKVIKGYRYGQAPPPIQISTAVN